MKQVAILLIGLGWAVQMQAQTRLYARQAVPDGQVFAPNDLVEESIVSNLNECYSFQYQDAGKKRLLHVERLCCGKLSDNLSQINVAKVTFKYDMQGNLIEKAQFNAQGKPQSFTRFRYQQGQLVEEAIFDASNKLFGKTQFRYDKAGRLVEKTFLDNKNRRQNTSLGYAIERREYDANGRPTLVAWYDEHGKLSRKTATHYDDKGNAVELHHIVYPDTSIVEIHQFNYDAAGRWIEKIETDSKNTSFRKTTRRYDSNGNLIEEATYDNLGRLIDNSVEIAKTIIDYHRGKKIRERTYNHANVLRTDVRYNDLGQVLERRQYASDGTLLEIKRNQYDAFGNLIAEHYSTHDNQQRERPVETRRYEKGRLIQKIRYDKSGKPL